jgi:2-polyprenyl-6-methoxyphenol hydroxylase-like FAD-dependent oxidoreductase
MASFKVIIVGGSVAGLTLANILERYQIDYIVLEKHASAAPQLGASLGFLPPGARILDQLGLFSRIEALSMSINESKMVGPDGLQLGSPQQVGEIMEELCVMKDVNMKVYR